MHIIQCNEQHMNSIKEVQVCTACSEIGKDAAVNMFLSIFSCFLLNNVTSFYTRFHVFSRELTGSLSSSFTVTDCYSHNQHRASWVQENDGYKRAYSKHYLCISMCSNFKRKKEISSSCSISSMLIHFSSVFVLFHQSSGEQEVQKILYI